MRSSRRQSRRVAALAITLLVAGAALIAGPIAHAIQAQVSAREARAVWEKWKHAHAGDAASAKPGKPTCWLRVPSCKISTLVMQESTAEALHRYPAARELEGGSRVVFAHRDEHFRPLAGLRVGDQVTAESADGRVTIYTVRTIRTLLPEQVPAAVDNPESRDALHLLTCYPFRYLGAAPKRFLATAVREPERTRSKVAGP